MNSALRSTVEPFSVMEVAKAAEALQRSHGGMIGLYVGQSATPASRVVRDQVRRP